MKLSQQDLKNMRENAKIANSDLSCALDYIERLEKVVEAAREEHFVDPLEGCSCYICPGCRGQKSKVVDTLKELDGEK